MNSNSNSNPDSERREVDASLLASLSRLSGRGSAVLSATLGLFAGLSARGAASPPLTGGYAVPSWLADLTLPLPGPSSPNGRSSSGVASAKRLARKQRNQRKAKRSLRG